MAIRKAFTVEDRLMLNIGEGWVVRRRRSGHFTFVFTMKHRDKPEEKVSEGSLTKLTQRGWVKPVPMDALWDVIEYQVTEKGQSVLADLWQSEGERR